MFNLNHLAMEATMRYVGVESRIVHRMRRALLLMASIAIGIVYSSIINL